MKNEIKRSYYKDGQIGTEEYYLDGKLYRPLEEGPALIGYHENGQIKYECYYLENKTHRPLEEGPAVISYYSDGKVSYEEYWLDGNRINLTEEDLKRIKFNKAFDLEVNNILQPNS